MHFSSSIITGRQLAHFLCSPKHCQVPCHLLERLPGFCLPPNYVRGLELCFPIKPWSCKNLTTSEMYQRVSSACPRHTVYVAEKGILWNWAGAFNAHQNPRWETFLYSPGKVPEVPPNELVGPFTFCIFKKLFWGMINIQKAVGTSCLQPDVFGGKYTPWSYHHNQCHKQIYRFQKFPSVPYFVCVALFITTHYLLLACFLSMSINPHGLSLVLSWSEGGGRFNPV